MDVWRVNPEQMKRDAWELVLTANFRRRIDMWACMLLGSPYWPKVQRELLNVIVEDLRVIRADNNGFPLPLVRAFQEVPKSPPWYVEFEVKVTAREWKPEVQIRFFGR